MLEQLNRTSLFKDLDYRDLDRIASICRYLELQDGEVLIQENDEAHRDLFILCDGAVEILSCGGNAISDEVVISDLDKDVLGEICWLTKHKRSATVRARGPVEAIQIDGSALHKFLDEHRDVGFLVMKRMAELLSDRLDETDVLLKQILWNARL